jgi:hypothetical protein
MVGWVPFMAHRTTWSDRFAEPLGGRGTHCIMRAVCATPRAASTYGWEVSLKGDLDACWGVWPGQGVASRISHAPYCCAHPQGPRPVRPAAHSAELDGS